MGTVLESRTFLRAIVQYVGYDNNAANDTFPVGPEFRHFFSQLLFSYKLNPRTVRFLGCTDDARTNQVYPLIRANCTFLMKVGYSRQMKKRALNH
jgi:hypothetical protein